MRIGIIGGNGKAGNCILLEAISRGHEVTAIVRDAAKVANDRAHVLERDIMAITAEDLLPFDAVVNAFGAPLGSEQLHVDAGNALIRALKDAPHTRLLVVGGAGSLYIDEARTIRLVDTPGFPSDYLATARSQAENLNLLKQTTGISWTFISPSAHFALGHRTGAYQLGTDRLLVNRHGDSYVSYEDYAVAVVDEIEQPRHLNQRFTVVSEPA